VKHLLLVLFLISPYSSFAAVERIKKTTIKRMLMHATSSYGGCMISIDHYPSDAGLDCGNGQWVSLGCESEHISPEGAERMLQNADKAFLLGWMIDIWIDDSIKHGSFCTAIRVDLLAPPGHYRNVSSNESSRFYDAD